MACVRGALIPGRENWLERVVRKFSFLSILLSSDTTSFGEDRSGKRISLKTSLRGFPTLIRAYVDAFFVQWGDVNSSTREIGHRFSSSTTVRQWTNLVVRPIDLRNVRDVAFRAGDLSGFERGRSADKQNSGRRNVWEIDLALRLVLLTHVLTLNGRPRLSSICPM